MSNQRRLSPFPVGPQRDLLRACLLSGRAATAAMARWEAVVDLPTLDQGSNRLLPLAVANVMRHGGTLRHRDRLQGVRRRHWLEVQLMLRRGAQVVERLNQAALPSLVLKGAALIDQAYGGAPVRSMADVDIAVPADDLSRAVAVLGEEGWRPEGSAAKRLARNPHVLRARNGAVNLRQPGDRGNVLDLHCRVFSLYDHHTVPFPEHVLYGAAEPFLLGTTPALRLAPHHQLLHSTFHGVQAQPVAPIRWIADAHRLLIATRGRFDWSALLRDARDNEMVLPLRAGLRFLVDTYDSPVPPEVLRALRTSRTHAVERLEARLRRGAVGLRADYMSTLARAMRSARKEPALSGRARELMACANRAAVRLPIKHWIRPALRGARSRPRAGRAGRPLPAA